MTLPDKIKKRIEKLDKAKRKRIADRKAGKRKVTKKDMVHYY